MALKIIKATDAIRIDRLNVCIYGPPGIGKSSLGFSADAPLLLDFDRGAHRAEVRRDSVRVNDWRDIADLDAEALAGYRTIIVDTAGRALDCLTADILRRDPKAGRNGVLSIKGFGTLKGEFIAWLKLLNGFGLDVILIAHMEESRNGDEIIERLDVQGGSKAEIYKAADAMGKIAMRDGKRVLTFDPSDTSFGKNPARLPLLAVPSSIVSPGFLAGVVERTKAALNAMNAAQAEAAAGAAEFRETLAQMPSTGEAFTSALESVKALPKILQAIFAAEATARGLVFDPAEKAYKAAA